MSDPVIIALIVAVGPTLIGLFNVYMTHRNSGDIKQVKEATDGMKDALVAVTRSDALQEGHAIGVQEQKDKQGTARREGDR
jgi:hypothetical protein